MRILISLTYYSPYISGLTIYVKRLAEELVKNNYVDILCYRHSRDLKTIETLNKIKVFRVKPWLKVSKGFISGAWISNSWIRVKNNDLIIVTLPQFEGFLTALIAKIMKKRVMAVYLCDVETPNKFVNKILELANKITLAIADKIVTITKDYADNSSILKGYGNKLRYIYPIIVKPEADNQWKVRARHKIGKGRVVIGVAARLAAEKGLEYLFEAIPNLKLQLGNNFCIALAGPIDPVGEEKYKTKIMILIEKYKDNIVILGKVPDEKMGSFYGLLDVLILPSINSTEAFGMVQVEAMMCGVPVIASDLPGVRIPVKKTGMGIIVPVKNSVRLAEAISEVISDKSKYRQADKVVGEFDPKISFDRFKDLFFG